MQYDGLALDYQEREACFMIRIRHVLTLLFVLAFAGPFAGAVEQHATLIRDARIFDGEKIIEATDLLIRSGAIDQIGKSLAKPDGATVVDATGCTLLPGLIDCHTHVISDTMLEQALVFGVTTELDMFMSYEQAARIKRENLPTRADLRTAGTLVTAPRGHGTQFGVKIPTLQKPEDADAFVAARVAEGSDYIKAVYDTGQSLGLRFPTLTRETLTGVAVAAKKRHKLLVVHVGDCQSAREAIEAGADGLVHVPYDGPPDGDFSDVAKAKNVFVVPTLTVIEGVGGAPGHNDALIADSNLAPHLTQADQDSLRAAFPRLRLPTKPSMDNPMATVRRLHEVGVPILAGTDAPNPGTVHGVSIHRELELLVQAGLKPIEALASGTSVPRKHFALKDRGIIETGARADLLLVKGDPTTDIRATRAIRDVWRAGQRLDRAAYAARVAQTKVAGAKAKGPGVTVVSDFEGKEITASFGAGWQISTDSIMGGKSTAEMKLADGSLRVTGTIDGRLPFAWAGTMFFPGDTPFAPADLSAKKALTFRAKGDGQPARVMVFAKRLGQIPASQDFTPGPEWKRFTFEINSFNKTDGRDLMGVLFTGGPKAGKFEFQIDDVTFE
jgi:imidazolonepropionase-like amidohydrolase